MGDLISPDHTLLQIRRRNKNSHLFKAILLPPQLLCKENKTKLPLSFLIYCVHPTPLLPTSLSITKQSQHRWVFPPIVDKIMCWTRLDTVREKKLDLVLSGLYQGLWLIKLFTTSWDAKNVASLNNIWFSTLLVMIIIILPLHCTGILSVTSVMYY